jgi:hypothetical protein
MVWDCGAGHHFEFLIRSHLVLNTFPFPVSTAKLLGDFFNNRRSAANSYPRFAYSFLFFFSPLCCTNTIILRFTLREQAKRSEDEKIPKNF